MKTLNFLRVPALAVLTLAVSLLLGIPTIAQDWVRVTDGRMPANALRAGNEADGTPLYIARGNQEGGLHPGKVRANALEAYIPYGGREIAVRDYEVYVGTGTWQEVRPGQRVPTTAIAGGRETDGTPIYIARATIEGGTHPGKAKGGEGWFPYGGQERYVSPFQVLVGAAGEGVNSVTIYNDCDYRGDSRTVGVGRYNWNQLGLPNDEISSLKVPAGYTVKLYSDAEFSGQSVNITGDVPCLTDRNFNDLTSSCEVFNGLV